MLKTISAALLAVSILAAPVMAAGAAPTTAQAAATVQVKKDPLNANAKMSRHHVRHHRHHKIFKHRAHKKMSATIHKSLKVSAKRVTHPAKRG